MELLKKSFSEPGRILIAGAPEGYDAEVLAHLAKDLAPQPILHVAEDEARMTRMAECLQFFAPHLEILTFPAWDCLPYDRVSPNSEAVARRIETLTRFGLPTAAAGYRPE